MTRGKGGGGGGARPARRRARTHLPRRRACVARGGHGARVRPPLVGCEGPRLSERDETCPVSTEGWTRRVHFVREGGREGPRPRPAVEHCRDACRARARMSGAAPCALRGSFVAAPPPSLLLPLPMSLLYTSVDASSSQHVTDAGAGVEDTVRDAEGERVGRGENVKSLQG